MLDKKITDLLYSQINKEFYSSYLYLDMSNYYIEKNLSGFGNWFSIQAQEEHEHAMLFVRYCSTRQKLQRFQTTPGRFT